MRPTRTAVAVVAAALAAAACSGPAAEETSTTTAGSAPETTATTAPATTAPATTGGEAPLRVTPRSYDDYRRQPTACGAERPPPVVEMTFTSPEQVELNPESTQAIISTSCGDIVIDLDVAGFPQTVNSFAFLAEQGFFDGSASHRIYPGYVIQAGDPTATGFGGPGFVIADEFPDEGFIYERGVVAMANAGPGTTGSQFFIMLADAALPPQYNVLGRVVGGFDVIDAIAAVELTLGPGGDTSPSTPLESVYIESVEVVR